MKREFLEGLGLEKDIIDKVMSEHGKGISDIKTEIDGLKSQITEKDGKIANYVTTVADLETKASGNKEIQDELDKLKTKIAEDETKKSAAEQDKILTTNIEAVFGDKKFINDYTKNAIVTDIKTGLKDPVNAGKSANDIFESLTKDKNGIFVNPNTPPNMPKPNPNPNIPNAGTVTKEQFDKMGYKDKVKMKTESPDQYDALSGKTE